MQNDIIKQKNWVKQEKSNRDIWKHLLEVRNFKDDTKNTSHINLLVKGSDALCQELMHAWPVNWKST